LTQGGSSTQLPESVEGELDSTQLNMDPIGLCIRWL